MNLSWRSEYKGEIKTLKLKKDPLRNGLGYYEDEDDVTWDVKCIIGADHTLIKRSYINARKVNVNMPYYSTAIGSHSNGCHKWIPYYFEVIGEESHGETI